MAVRVDVDRERCIGAGHCVRSVPGLFDQDEDDGRVILLSAEPGADVLDAVREVVELCPSRALTLHGG
ncbi:ferredoxin [Streptomyces sp. NPDC048473]|uniref:ferredoxin n=1 Tax=unclassified Streptomyces TaxID=2593676 RepID=UPI00371FFDA1